MPGGDSPCKEGDKLPDGVRSRLPKEPKEPNRRMLDRPAAMPAIESGVIVPDEPRARLPDEPNWPDERNRSPDENGLRRPDCPVPDELNRSPDEEGLRRLDCPGFRRKGEVGAPDGDILN